MANGTIPGDQRNVLHEIEEWLKINGEAIYETRPWITFGEGPTKEPEGHFQNWFIPIKMYAIPAIKIQFMLHSLAGQMEKLYSWSHSLKTQ